jgi:nickel/cobalt transporter (NicO) family protein
VGRGSAVVALTLFPTESAFSLESLLRTPSSDPLFLVSALALAFLLGAAHAITPGHGKAVVAAYLAGSRGRISDAVYLGTIVTATHTATVFALGLAALYAAGRTSVDRIYSWLSLASGGLVALAGAWLLWKRLGRRGAGLHSPGHAHRHDHTPTHAHRGTLLSLGVSGGLVPCPEALVVLLISVASRKLPFGLGLLVSFSFGLAAVLIAIGIATVAAGPFAERWFGRTRWGSRVPVASAACITLLGLAMVVRDLAFR